MLATLTDAPFDDTGWVFEDEYDGFRMGPYERRYLMSKEPVQIEVVQEGDERFIVKTYADGSEERVPVVKLPRKPPRYPYRKVSFDKSRKKGF